MGGSWVLGVCLGGFLVGVVLVMVVVVLVTVLVVLVVLLAREPGGGLAGRNDSGAVTVAVGTLKTTMPMPRACAA